MRNRTRVGALALVLGVGVGCTLSRPLAYHAVSYNRAVESAQNRMMLLNVVRAMERSPMYFTGIGSITASLSYTVSSGGLTLGRASGGSLTTSGDTVTDVSSEGDTDSLGLPTVSYSNKPTVQVSVLDGQDFMRGTLTAVTPEVFGYYLQHGWRPDLLTYLLVERIELDRTAEATIREHGGRGGQALAFGPGQRVAIENDPEDAEAFALFRSYVDGLRDLHCSVEEVEGARELGTVYGALSMSDLVKAGEAGLMVEEVAVERDGAGETTQRAFRILEPETKLRCSDPRRPEEALFEAGVNQEAVGTAAAGGELTFFLRAPQGVVYYLGEVARVWNEADGELAERVPLVRLGAGETTGFACPQDADELCLPVFLARRPGEGCDRALVAVEHDGSSFMIPAADQGAPLRGNLGALDSSACHPGRSMQALTLVSQLISLQKSGDDLPGTALVRVVGQ